MAKGYIQFTINNLPEGTLFQPSDFGETVGKVTFGSILDTMAQFPPIEYSGTNKEWVAFTELCYSWKTLYVGREKKYADRKWDNGPSFFYALLSLQKNGPPNYYPKSDLELFRKEIDMLIDKMLLYRADIQKSC